MTDPVPSKNVSYWQKLKRHPGARLVLWLAVLGLLAGLPDWKRGLVGAAVMLAAFGPIVLWTARTQP